MATLSTAAKNAALDAIGVLLDAGSIFDRCVLRLFTPGFGSAVLFNFLATSSPTFNAASGGAMSVRTLPNNWTDSSSDAVGTGIATGYTISDGNGISQIFNATGVGLTGSGAEIEMDNTNVRVDQGFILDSFELFIP
jgi:hypothetical protein